MIDWNGDGKRDSFDFAMDMMTIEEMERASSKRKSYNTSYKSSSSGSSDGWASFGCSLYLLFLVVGPVFTVLALLLEGEVAFALVIIVLAVILNYAVMHLLSTDASSQSPKPDATKTENVVKQVDATQSIPKKSVV